MKFLIKVLILFVLAAYFTACASPESSRRNSAASISTEGALFFGDSFTAAPTYPKLVSDTLGIPAINLGVGGHTTSQTIKIIRQRAFYPGVRYGQASFWLVGYNDERLYSTDPGYLDEYADNLREGISLLGRNGHLFIGNTVRMMTDSYRIGSYRNGSDESVRLHNEVLVGVVSEMKSAGFNVDLVDVSAGYDPYTMSEGDLMHPNSVGYEYIANCFLSAYYNLFN